MLGILYTFSHLNLTETTWDRILESRTPNSELQCWVTGAPLSIKRFSHRHILIIGILMYIANAGDARDEGSDPWVWKIPWRRKWHPTPAFLPEKSHGQRSLMGYSPKGHKESDTTE